MTPPRRAALPVLLVLAAAALSGAVALVGVAGPASGSIPDGSGASGLLLRDAAAALPGMGGPAAPDTATAGAAGPQAAPSGPATSGDPASAAALGRRVEADLAASGADTVAAAVDVAGLGQVLRRDADHPLPPASTRKTFLAAAALLALGQDSRYVTAAVATAAPSRGVLRGNLWLVAGGDPYLTSTGLRALAHQVRAAGVTRVGGDLLLDDGRYDASRHPAGWKSDFVPSESGPLSAMSLDGNTWRTDGAFLSDPALPAAGRFLDALKAEGVTVHGRLRRAARPGRGATLASVSSGPVSAVVRRLTKASDNFAAELVTKELGHAASGDGSSAGGVAAVRDALAPLGVAPGPSTDGSGLSASDRQTASGELALLEAVEGTSVGPAFRAALPVACRDGTLVHRMCGTPAEGRVWAKTGTLDFVNALAGYTTTASGRQVWFSFVLTGVHDAARARAALDHATQELVASTD